MSLAPASSSAQAARKALADRLKDLRKDAQLNSRELSDRCGWHPAKTSRIQAAKIALSEADIRAWCAACGVEDQVPDLIAASRAVESMYVEWRRLKAAGLKSLQDSYAKLYEQTGLFRFYTSDVVPGVLQTAAYVRAIMTRSAVGASRSEEDLEQAISAKMDRANIIQRGNHRFLFLLEESVLRYQLGDAGAMAGQLGHLLAVIPLPRVSLGVIPFSVSRKLWPVESFRIYDEARVQVELVTASVNVTAPTEVIEYLTTFAELQSMAVYGAKARELITAAIAALG
ncbi:helix-turn-helix transcriptional regulator [Kitasatospora sp. NPDC002227]|uniref:helix-turn-helix domain-containing protein n=1 Tax=Kitasatospora sp. NPDC002227 TaxID=3154773 RepID=UPI00331E3FCB